MSLLEEELRRHLRNFPIDEESLQNTPSRMLGALEEMTAGYSQSPKDILSKTFEDAEGVGNLAVVREVRFWSLCQHHMLPFEGVCSIGYVPAGRVVGLSKVPRLVECFAKRLQLQERLGQQIVSALVEHVSSSAICLIKARHSCMAMRGVESDGELLTLAYSGVFDYSLTAREEFLRMVQS